MYDICIIGGGASGMVAAIRAKESNPSLNILIIEKKNQMGRKILASGNGKCNLSNVKCPNYERISQFFSEIGVVTKEDAEGRVYPYNEEARTVINALDARIRALGINVLTDTQVLEITKTKNFSVKTPGKVIDTRKVLVATGGKSGPAFGTTGDGYKWARAFGHHVNKPIPVLTAVEIKENIQDLAGIRAKGNVFLYYDDRLVFQEQGEIQFTKTGVSGICVFNLSRFLLIPEGKTLQDGFDQYQICIDFLPELKDLERYLVAHPEGLASLVKRPIAERVFALGQGKTELITQLLHEFPLTPSGVKGWDFAQATKGGVALSEINLETMESTLEKNLFFSGEVVDFDGPCGGFNLQFAWETGLKVGEAMAYV